MTGMTRIFTIRQPLSAVAVCTILQSVVSAFGDRTRTESVADGIGVYVPNWQVPR